MGPDQSTREVARVTGDRRIAAQPDLRRHRGRARIRRPRQAWGLRAAGHRGAVLPRAGHFVGPNVEHGSTHAGVPALPVTGEAFLRCASCGRGLTRSVVERPERRLRFEMTPRESPSRAGFQIALESDGTSLIREFDDDVTLPRSARDRVGTAARVVVRQSGGHIRREADVELRISIGVSQNVDEALVASHALLRGKQHARARTLKWPGTRTRRLRRSQFPQAGDADGWSFLPWR